MVAFTYTDPIRGEETGRIVVRDLAGRIVATLMMNGPQGQQIWDTRGIAPGTYLVRYLRGGELVHAERLIIQQ